MRAATSELGPGRQAPALCVLAACLAAAGSGGWRSAPEPLCEQPRADSVRAHGVADVRCSGAGAPPDGAVGLLFGIPLDLGRASREDLEALPGIGPRRAAAIEAARVRGPFCHARDLMRVSGIGPRTSARLEPWVRGAQADECTREIRSR